MRVSICEAVETDVSEATGKALFRSLLNELKPISEKCRIAGDAIEVESVNASFGSILRDDNTSVVFRPNSHNTGYVIEATINYRPSVWFWIFFGIDFVLIETIVGFVVGMALTLGLYFYNKNLVQTALHQALRNAAKSAE